MHFFKKSPERGQCLIQREEIAGIASIKKKKKTEKSLMSMFLNETQHVPASSREVWAQASLSGVTSFPKLCGGKKEK